MSKTERNQGKLMIIRPLGPQGPKIGVELTEVGDLIALDSTMGSLPADERKTVKGIRSAIKTAGLNEIESLRSSSQENDPSNDLSPIGEL